MGKPQIVNLLSALQENNNPKDINSASYRENAKDAEAIVR